jgi:hypothetical protein
VNGLDTHTSQLGKESNLSLSQASSKEAGGFYPINMPSFGHYKCSFQIRPFPIVLVKKLVNASVFSDQSQSWTACADPAS